MIRTAKIEDISRIAEILVFGKRCAYRRIFNDDAGAFNGLQVLSAAREYLERPELLQNVLVYDDGIVKGILNGSLTGDMAEIRELYVEPFFTGMGIGRALMLRFLSDARENGALHARLWVLRNNARARAFYESLGFTQTGEEGKIPGTDVFEMRYQMKL